jgi:hypothetical protein
LISGAKANKFTGSGSHEFMLWLSEWKKYLVYHGIHQIILEGLDSQGKSHEESISKEFPWIWGYYSQKQITLGSTMMDSIPIVAPDYSICTQRT